MSTAKKAKPAPCYLHPLAQSVGPLDTAAGPRPACWSCMTIEQNRKRFMAKGAAEAGPIAPPVAPATTSATSSADTRRLPHEWPARVVDGDTIAVELHAAELSEPFPVHVRILGIDAPERDTVEGKASTAALSAIVASTGGKVVMEPDEHHPDRDRWGRLLRHVFVSGVLVARSLLAGGAAALDDRFPPTKYDGELRPLAKSIRGK